MESSISIPCPWCFHATVPETERNATNVAGEGATPSGGTRIEGLSSGLRCVHPRGAARVRTERCPRPLFPTPTSRTSLVSKSEQQGATPCRRAITLQRLLGRRVAHTHVDDGSIPSAATSCGVHPSSIFAREGRRCTVIGTSWFDSINPADRVTDADVAQRIERQRIPSFTPSPGFGPTEGWLSPREREVTGSTPVVCTIGSRRYRLMEGHRAARKGISVWHNLARTRADVGTLSLTRPCQFRS